MSLRFKTVIGVALIEALLLALLIVTVTSYQRTSAEDALLKRANTTAKLFATATKDPLLSFDLASLDSFSNELMTNPGLLYVRVLADDGKVYSQAGDTDILARPFFEDLSLEEVDDNIFDTSTTITEGGIEYGRIELGIDTGSIQEVIAKARQNSIGIAGIEMGLVALFSLMLGTYLTRQLKVLQLSAKQISAGDYTGQIAITGRDEISEVASAFNRMSKALLESQQTRDQYENELRDLNQTLEDRVVRRTARINAQVTELQQANTTIAETQARLGQSEKLASLGKLAAGVAHEINNPIGFVRSNLTTLTEYVNAYQSLIARYQLLGDANESDRKQLHKEILQLQKKEDFEFINDDILELLKDSIDGTSRVRNIVSGLKDFAHMGGKNRELCNINNCVSSTLKIVKNGLSGNSRIETDLQEVPMIKANSGEINQVLMNLLVNASQAIDDGGQIKVMTSEENDKVCITISDTGSGIAPENIERLFDPFFTTKPVGEGTGLGLAITYGLVKDHGGNIDVSSKQGVGTTFKITLPLSEQLPVTLAA